MSSLSNAHNNETKRNIESSWLVCAAIKKFTIAPARLSEEMEFKNFPVAFHERVKEKAGYIFSRLPRETTISRRVDETTAPTSPTSRIRSRRGTGGCTHTETHTDARVSASSPLQINDAT